MSFFLICILYFLCYSIFKIQFREKSLFSNGHNGGRSTCALHKLSFPHSTSLFKSSFYTASMGTSGLEPPTSRLSGVRSNHLSYAPIQNCFANRRTSAVCSALPKLLASLLWCFCSFLNLIPFAVPDVFDNRFFLLLVSCILLLRWWR